MLIYGILPQIGGKTNFPVHRVNHRCEDMKYRDNMNGGALHPQGRELSEVCRSDQTAMMGFIREDGEG